MSDPRITDQLADLWHVSAEVRAAGAELEQEILAAPKLVAAEQLVSDAIRDSLAFENEMPRGHLLLQIANRASHLLFQRGVISPESAQPMVDREALYYAIEQAAERTGLAKFMEEEDAEAFTEAVLALLNGGAK